MTATIVTRFALLLSVPVLFAASTIPPGGCTIVVSIKSSTPGTVTNTTSSLQTEAGTTPPASLQSRRGRRSLCPD